MIEKPGLQKSELKNLEAFGFAMQFILEAQYLALHCTASSVSLAAQIRIPIASVTSITRTNTAILIPNAICVVTTQGQVGGEYSRR